MVSVRLDERALPGILGVCRVTFPPNKIPGYPLLKPVEEYVGDVPVPVGVASRPFTDLSFHFVTLFVPVASEIVVISYESNHSDS